MQPHSGETFCCTPARAGQHPHTAPAGQQPSRRLQAAPLGVEFGGFLEPLGEMLLDDDAEVEVLLVVSGSGECVLRSSF